MQLLSIKTANPFPVLLLATFIDLLGMYLVFASFMYFHIALEVYTAYLVYAFGKGLFEPSISSLVSKTANDHEQGKAQGTYQSLQSLTRVIGPVTAAFLYNIHKGLPYIVCAVLTFISAILFLRLRKR